MEFNLHSKLEQLKGEVDFLVVNATGIQVDLENLMQDVSARGSSSNSRKRISSTISSGNNNKLMSYINNK